MIMVIFMIMNVYDYDDYHDYLKVSWYIIWMIMNDYDDIYIYMEPKKELKVLRWYMFLIIIIFDRFMFEL